MTKKVIVIAAALVLFAALVLPLNAQPTSLLHEEFEGTFPPTDWTTSQTTGSNQWYRNDYTSLSNYTPGANGFCACNDDDWWWGPLLQNNRLTSPAFDASGCTEVWLAFDHDWNNIGSYDEAFVEVYDGSSWTEVERYDPGGSADFTERDSIDITADVNGATNAQVRFVYDEIAYTWAWWWQVDDVDVWGTGGGPSKPAFVDTLFCEYFETPRPNWMPAGWSQIIQNGTYPYGGSYPHRATWWHFQAGDVLYDATTGIGTGCACTWFDASYSMNQNEWLKTFSVDLTGYDPEDSVDLQFNSMFYMTTNSVFHNYIWVSTDGGATWDGPIADLSKDYGSGDAFTFINDYPNPLSFRISEYLGDTIMIGFNYVWQLSGAAGIWTIDNVCVFVSGGGGNGGEEDSLDLEMMAIIRPKTEEAANVPFTPEILVVNNLDSTTHARISCKIKELGGSTVYEDVLSVVPLEPGENDVYGFKAFTPEGGKEYNALFVLEHPDDINPDNDHLDKNFHATVGMDVTPFEIVLPADVQDGSFKPTAKYTEKAGAETETNLVCEITNQSGASVYKKSVSHTFAANETWTESTFPVPDIESGTYTITFWAENPLDASNISFPPISKIFEFTTSIAETPVPERTSLEVLGHTVNFALSEASHVNIRVYDAAGKAVTTLVDGSRGPGSYTMNWNTSGVAAGVYFVRMITPEFNATRKVMVLH